MKLIRLNNTRKVFPFFIQTKHKTHSHETKYKKTQGSEKKKERVPALLMRLYFWHHPTLPQRQL